MASATYDKIFNLLKSIEVASELERHAFNFSAAGRDQNLKFKLYFNRNEHGTVAYELLEAGEISLARSMLLAGRDTIQAGDVTAVAEQMVVLKVSPVISDKIVQIVEGLRRMEVSAPVFALNKAVKKRSGNTTEYIFGLAAYVLDDNWEPIGRVTFNISVWEMSQLEKTGLLIRETEERRKAEAALPLKDPITVMVPDVSDGGNDRYKISAMIQPGSPAMEQLRAKETAVVKD